MTDDKLGLRFLVEVGLSYVEGIFPNIDTTLYDQLGQVLEAFLRGSMSFEFAQQFFLSILGRVDPLTHIRDIAQLPDEPIPSTEGDDGDSGDEAHNRKKTRTWTSYEDQRLIAGIYRFGLDNWSQVAQFVGNNRTRAQCSQRWSRGLNPRICKKHWSPEEDAQLIHLVRTYGEKAWTKIASCLGNRSDVQCRYHYRQITKDGQPQPQSYLGLSKSMPISLSSGVLTQNRIPTMAPAAAAAAAGGLYPQARMPLGTRMPMMLAPAQQSILTAMSQSAMRLPLATHTIMSSMQNLAMIRPTIPNGTPPPPPAAAPVPPTIPQQPAPIKDLQTPPPPVPQQPIQQVPPPPPTNQESPGLDSFLGHFKLD